MRKVSLMPSSIMVGLFIAVAGTDRCSSGPLTMGFGDIATVKQKAESGDAVAQLALADALAGSFRPGEALTWYRKAAAQGNVAAVYRLGELLLNGAVGIPPSQSVQPNHAEAVQWTFAAATNKYPQAYYNMSRILREGLGVKTNVVEAYAWLVLFADTPGGSIVGRVHMNELALRMDTNALAQANRLSAQFKAGGWSRPLARTIPEGDPRLKLGGMTIGGQRSLAVINGKTFAEGESGVITIKPGKLTIKCLKIEKDSVLISVEGEDAPRLLRLR
jgi:hypothetical protein